MNTDNVFLTVVIDADDCSAVSMLDIENDFQHTENDEYVLMMLRCNMAELLVNLDPKLYQKYVIT